MCVEQSSPKLDARQKKREREKRNRIDIALISLGF